MRIEKRFKVGEWVKYYHPLCLSEYSYGKIIKAEKGGFMIDDLFFRYIWLIDEQVRKLTKKDRTDLAIKKMLQAAKN